MSVIAVMTQGQELVSFDGHQPSATFPSSSFSSPAADHPTRGPSVTVIDVADTADSNADLREVVPGSSRWERHLHFFLQLSAVAWLVDCFSRVGVWIDGADDDTEDAFPLAPKTLAECVLPWDLLPYLQVKCFGEETRTDEEILAAQTEVSVKFCIITALCYVTQVLPTISSTVLVLHAEELGIGPVKATLIVASVILPWSLKPIFGFFMDSFPIFGKSRKYYIFLCALLSGGSAWYFGTKDGFDADDLETVMLAQSWASACGDVATDALIVQRVTGKPVSVSSSMQTIIWTSAAVMGLVMSFGWETMMSVTGGYQQAYAYLVAPVFFLVALLALTITEPTARGTSMRTLLKILKSTIGTVVSADILPMIVFGFLYRATPSLSMTLYYRYEHGFTTQFLTHLSGFAKMASILSGFAAQYYISKHNLIPYRALIGISTLAEATIGLAPVLITTGMYLSLDISPEYLTLGGALLSEVVDNFQTMIFFTVLARRCSADAAGTTFAVMMAMLNAGSRVKKDLDALVMREYDIACEYEANGTPMCNWDGLSPSIILCQATSFLVLILFIWWLPAFINNDDEGREGNQNSIQGEEGQRSDQSDGERRGRSRWKVEIENGRDTERDVLKLTAGEAFVIDIRVHPQEMTTSTKATVDNADSTVAVAYTVAFEPGLDSDLAAAISPAFDPKDRAAAVNASPPKRESKLSAAATAISTVTTAACIKTVGDSSVARGTAVVLNSSPVPSPKYCVSATDALIELEELVGSFLSIVAGSRGNKCLTRDDRRKTLFHTIQPNISINKYVVRLMRVTRCSGEAAPLSVVYMDRLMQRRRGINVNSFTVHRILLTTLMLAAKFLDDYVASNRVWAFAGGVSVKQLNSMERRFLELISFDLYAEVPELENTKEKMKKLCIKRNQFAGVM